MKTLADYTVVVTPDDGTFVAYVPAIEGCYAVANTPEEARRELDFVFEMFVEEFAEVGKTLPPDVKELVAVAGG
jgi:predicted RNase H-like HicB family nuclease